MSSSTSLTLGSVVWCDLGHSFGWWTAYYAGKDQDPGQRARKERKEKLQKEGKEVLNVGNNDNELISRSIKYDRFLDALMRCIGKDPERKFDHGWNSQGLKKIFEPQYPCYHRVKSPEEEKKLDNHLKEAKWINKSNGKKNKAGRKRKANLAEGKENRIDVKRAKMAESGEDN